MIGFLLGIAGHDDSSFSQPPPPLSPPLLAADVLELNLLQKY